MSTVGLGTKNNCWRGPAAILQPVNQSSDFYTLFYLPNKVHAVCLELTFWLRVGSMIGSRQWLLLHWGVGGRVTHCN
jgi:hypothetical protein